MKTVYVIHETDLGDNEKSVIGVADSLLNVDILINSYYGKHDVIEFDDIRDSSLEWMKIIQVDGILPDTVDRYKLLVQSFCVNE